MNGAVSGTFLVLTVIILCHLEGTAPTVALVLVPLAFLAGVGAAHLTPTDPEWQDRVGFAATLVLLFAILLWAIEGVFEPLLGFLGRGAARALAPLVPSVALYLIARRLLDFDHRDWGLRLLPDPRATPLHVVAALVGVAGVSMLHGRLTATPDLPVAALAVVIVAFEELLYRGFLLSALAERVGGGTAILLQAIVYVLGTGLAHLAPVPLITRFALGLACGAAALHTGWVSGVWIARIAGLALAWWVLAAR